jgi:hypothetical protein
METLSYRLVMLAYSIIVLSALSSCKSLFYPYIYVLPHNKQQIIWRSLLYHHDMSDRSAMTVCSTVLSSYLPTSSMYRPMAGIAIFLAPNLLLHFDLWGLFWNATLCSRLSWQERTIENLFLPYTNVILYITYLTLKVLIDRNSSPWYWWGQTNLQECLRVCMYVIYNIYINLYYALAYWSKIRRLIPFSITIYYLNHLKIKSFGYLTVCVENDTNLCNA